MPNAHIREMCGVTRRVDETINESILWFGVTERMRDDRLAKRVHVKERVR